MGVHGSIADVCLTLLVSQRGVWTVEICRKEKCAESSATTNSHQRVEYRLSTHIPVPSPVERRAVVGVEQRAEFVVIPISEGRTPMLARRPRLFYGQKTDVYEAEVTIESIRDSERYYAELEIVCSEDAFVQYDQSKIRAFIGTHCRFHGERITHCGCGICAELRGSLSVDYKHDKEDEYHYV